MSATTLIYVVGLSIASMAFIFLFMLLRPNEVTKEKLQSILGEDALEKIKNAKSDDELKQIIRSLSKRRKLKLKTLMESQDIRDVINAIKQHILKDESDTIQS
ncbi:MAG: 4-hydroxy-3-methylbut-2-en-1-yl diphosphate synthase [Epsilonproteobacteria bacterium]|nr:4-hydroxy-3-methylbut-2-en-1-yl diphosphate synthase [Campylobacterota bacterium]